MRHDIIWSDLMILQQFKAENAVIYILSGLKEGFKKTCSAITGSQVWIRKLIHFSSGVTGRWAVNIGFTTADDFVSPSPLYHLFLSIIEISHLLSTPNNTKLSPVWGKMFQIARRSKNGAVLQHFSQRFDWIQDWSPSQPDLNQLIVIVNNSIL